VGVSEWLSERVKENDYAGLVVEAGCVVRA
jgi:hypothetical protein